ncbi:hypothetical protein IWQ60_009202 [Tieghemiomyces parasiticus]|uniref:ABC transporter domain-containing protein n=1 Tax=Tieghemiomyces parasiticus TaxID=78921 RepID=A0A9W7ZNX3_9FUNG|nr:hypothetical protein IWQ60_009202 [Tieghemiomyces parasiticus]
MNSLDFANGAPKTFTEGDRAPHYSLNWDMVKRIARLTRVQFRPPADVRRVYGSVLLPCVALILVAAANEVVVYFTGLIPSDYYSVLVAKDTDAFYPLLGRSLGIVVAAGLGQSLVTFAAGRYQVRTRLVLSHCIQTRYLRPLPTAAGGPIDGVADTEYNHHSRLPVPPTFSSPLYRIVDGHLVDNPDQRITQDVDKFAVASSELLQQLVLSPILVVYYTVETWEITGYFGPLLIYLFFVLGTIISRFLMTPVISLTWAQERQEGTYRFQHVHVRNHAGPLTMQRGHHYEHLRLNQALRLVANWQRRIVNRRFWLNLSTNVFGYLGSILSYLVIAIPIFNGWYDGMDDPAQVANLVSKASFIAMYLIFRFTVIVQQAAAFSDYAGYVMRITQLLDTLEMLTTKDGAVFKPAETKVDSDEDSVVKFSVGSVAKQRTLVAGTTGTQVSPTATTATAFAITIDHLDAVLPTGYTLFRDVTVTIRIGDHLLVTGPNGCGKSSLIRILSGLWTAERGQISLPSSPTLKVSSPPPGPPFLDQDDLPRLPQPYHSWQPAVLFFSQQPYLPFGSLYDQIVYPNAAIDTFNDFEVPTTRPWVTKLTTACGIRQRRSSARRGSDSTGHAVRYADGLPYEAPPRTSSSHSSVGSGNGGYHHDPSHSMAGSTSGGPLDLKLATNRISREATQPSNGQDPNLSDSDSNHRGPDIDAMSPLPALISDPDLRHLLHRVGLGRLAHALPLHEPFSATDWTTRLLSPGQQQRLVFARLLFLNPTFAVVDEPCSSIDAAGTTDLYALAQRRGITFLSVSHQPDVLAAFHRQHLAFDGEGSYTLSRI